MRRKCLHLPACLPIVVALIATACAQAQDMREPVQAQAGQDTVLTVGQALEFSLQANASTGYAWQLLDDGAPVLRRDASARSTQPPPARPPMPGSPTQQYWRFVATQPGMAEVRLENRRPWIKDGPPTRAVAYRVRVLASSSAD